MGLSENFTICSVTGIFSGKNGVKREKHSECGSPVGENTLLIVEVRGEWAD